MPRLSPNVISLPPVKFTPAMIQLPPAPTTSDIMKALDTVNKNLAQLSNYMTNLSVTLVEQYKQVLMSNEETSVQVSQSHDDLRKILIAIAAQSGLSVKF